MVNVAKIYSTLGNSNSLIPLAVKDLSATAGMTAGSFVTGKEEGQDRFIDEMGTEAIWLLGIPTFKAIFDKTVFKALNMDSKFDARNLKDKEILEQIKKHAQDEKVKKSIEKIASNQKTFKNAVIAKFAVSTALTIGSYIGLTKFKQAYTEKKIRKNLIAEYEAKKEQNNAKNSEITSSQSNDKENVVFKGLGSAIEGFVFNPVKNMWIVDGAITGERLKESRSPQEFIGYSIKEAFTLCFMYYAGEKIQNAWENHAKEKYNKTIGLDARVIEDGSIKKAFEDGTVEKSLAEFKNANTSTSKLYEFLHTNPDNLIVKTAKKSDIIAVCKGSDKIDVRKFFDKDGIEGVNTKISELYSQYKEAVSKGTTSEEFFNGVKKLKRTSIKMNIGTCILALGVITPGLMLLKRLTGKDDEEFQTKKEIRQKLIKEGVIV